MTEIEYGEAKAELTDLRKRYNALSTYNRQKPYIGQQMARDMSQITLAVKEYDRLKNLAGAATD